MKLAISACLVAATIWAQPAAAPAFEVASIKASDDLSGHSGVHTTPGFLRVQNESLQECIMVAYGVQGFQISGGPSWLESQRFDIEARTAGPTGDDQLMLMLRTLLADRFHLALHRETRPAVGYALVVAKGGLKIKANETPGNSSTHHSRNSFTAQNMSMESLAATVSDALGTPVTDATGVSGAFDIALKWSPEESPAKAVDNVSTVPSLPEALQQQLGLRLESRKVSMEVLVVEHAEKPTEN